MIEYLDAFLIPKSSFGFALLIAASTYSVTVFFGKHLNSESKENLTLWLWGEYKSSWSHNFCNLFDTVFGSKHLSLTCFFRSSFASIASVAFLYFLFSSVLGLLGGRAAGDLDLIRAITIGAAINVIPDYISLYETRWLLNRFEHVHSFIGQLCVLVVDALLTGLIIWVGISAFQYVFNGQTLSAVEVVAVFSIYSVFFYSTFLTSAWAWFYCVSTWLMRLFSQGSLNRFLDVEHRPVSSIALVVSITIFISTLTISHILNTLEQSKVSSVDDMLCELFASDICAHVARISNDEMDALEYLLRACEAGRMEHCPTDEQIKSIPMPVIRDQPSIDLSLQKKTQKIVNLALEKMDAAAVDVVIMDARNGAILAAASQSSTESLKFHHLLRRFEPGSIVKAFPIAFALENELIDLDDKIDASEPFQADGFTIRDFHGKARALTIPEAFIYSSNIAAAKLVSLSTPDRYFKFLENIGLLSTINHPGLDSTEVTALYRKENIKDIDLYTTAFGHGINISVFHLLKAYGTFANGGKSVTPTFGDQTNVTSKTQRISKQTSKIILDLMELTVIKGSGQSVQMDDLRIAGRTGTAEKVKNGRYNSNYRLNSFISIFPMENPKYIVLAIVDEPRKAFDQNNIKFKTAAITAVLLTREVILAMRQILNF